MKTSEATFLRGSLVLQPASHVVIVQTVNGGQHLRRVSLTLEQMASLEAALMRLKHDANIRDYIITAAEHCNFTELLAWVGKFAEPAEQGELLNIQVNTLFEGAS